MNAPIPFDKVYQTKVVPALDALEPQRKWLENIQAFQLFTILLGGAGIIAFIALGIYPPALIVTGLSVLFAIGLRMQGYHEKRAAYDRQYKQTVINSLVQAVVPGAVYVPNQAVPAEAFAESWILLADWDHYYGEDYVEGRIGNTLYCFSEIRVSLNTEKKEVKKLVYAGLFFAADFNKNLRGRTIVWCKGDSEMDILKTQFTWLGKELSRVKLEDMEFEDVFRTWSDDQVEARYVLSPALMVRMVELQRKMKKKVSFSFTGSNVYVGIPELDDLFEAPFNKRSPVEDLEKFYQIVQLLTGIVEELNLNVRIWNKA